MIMNILNCLNGSSILYLAQHEAVCSAIFVSGSQLVLLQPSRVVGRLLQLSRLLVQLKGGAAVLTVARQVQPFAALARGRREDASIGRRRRVLLLLLLLLLLVRYVVVILPLAAVASATAVGHGRICVAILPSSTAAAVSVHRVVVLPV